MERQHYDIPKEGGNHGETHQFDDVYDTDRGPIRVVRYEDNVNGEAYIYDEEGNYKFVPYEVRKK